MREDGPTYIVRGSRDYLRVAFAMLGAGFSTFALMNCVQPLMPVFSDEFGISASQASLSLSLNIAALAVVMPFAGAIAETAGRKRVMATSLFLSALLTFLSAFAPSWPAFLVYRALQGVAFSGLPAVAMAYMGEEIHPAQRAQAISLYVSGAAIGGMSGRVIAGVVADFYGWQGAMLAIGVISLACAITFLVLLPPSRHFRAQPVRPGPLVANYRAHLADPSLRLLYGCGFLLMGSLTAIYNAMGYHLLEPPFSFSHAQIGLLFGVYAFGIVSSVVAGSLADRFGPSWLLMGAIGLALAGVLAMMSTATLATSFGLVAFTIGYFAAHALASGWVGRRAKIAKAQASAIYLFCFYVGGAALGWAGGALWGSLGWTGVSLGVAVALAIALAIAVRLHVSRA